MVTTEEEAKDDEEVIPPMDAESLLAAGKLVNDMRYYNDVLIVLCIVTVMLTLFFGLTLVHKKISQKLKSHELYSLISLLVLIILLIMSFRSSFMELKSRLDDPPCEAEPPLRVDPSNKVYAISSFLYIFFIILIRAVFHIAQVFIVLYMIYLLLNRCLLNIAVYRFEMSEWWFLIIPAILYIYQRIVDLPFMSSHFITVCEGICKFISPSCLLQYTNVLDRGESLDIHKRVFMYAVGFAMLFGVVFINTADKDASCESKKEAQRFEVFKNRSIFGSMIIITIMVMVYMGMWVKTLAVKLTR